MNHHFNLRFFFFSNILNTVTLRRKSVGDRGPSAREVGRTASRSPSVTRLSLHYPWTVTRSSTRTLQSEILPGRFAGPRARSPPPGHVGPRGRNAGVRGWGATRVPGPRSGRGRGRGAPAPQHRPARCHCPGALVPEVPPGLPLTRSRLLPGIARRRRPGRGADPTDTHGCGAPRSPTGQSASPPQRPILAFRFVPPTWAVCLRGLPNL